MPPDPIPEFRHPVSAFRWFEDTLEALSAEADAPDYSPDRVRELVDEARTQFAAIVDRITVLDQAATVPTVLLRSDPTARGRASMAAGSELCRHLLHSGAVVFSEGQPESAVGEDGLIEVGGQTTIKAEIVYVRF